MWLSRVALLSVLSVGPGTCGCSASTGSLSPAPFASRPPPLPAKSTVADLARVREPVRWSTRLDRDHVLVGRIWSVRLARFVEEQDLMSLLHGYVLIGEKHDNPDHHVLQTRLLQAMVNAGRKPTVAFEMFDEDDQNAVERSRLAHPQDAASIAVATKWDKSGWPPWANYAPIVQVALDASLPVVATGLPRARMRALMSPRDPKGAPTTQPPLDEGVPLTEAQTASLRDELRESHCGHLPETRFAGMIRFQRARDAAMAEALVASARTSGIKHGVLIAGTGHIRLDRGAGRDLAAKDPEVPIVSVALAEVEAGKTDPSAYAARWNTPQLPFDFVWFTPRATDADPCAAFAP